MDDEVARIKSCEYTRAYRERQKLKGLKTYKLRSEMTETEIAAIRERQKIECLARKERGVKRNINQDLLAKRLAKYKALGIKKNSRPPTEEQKARYYAKYLAERNTPEFKAKQKERDERHRAKLRAQGISPYKPYTEKQKVAKRKYRRERYAAGLGIDVAKKRRAETREKTRINKNAWRLKNIDKAREYERIYQKVRKATPHGKITNTVRSAMTSNLKSGTISSKYSLILGYTWGELQSHIVTHFKDGMTWEKYILGEIHIDHIKPLKLFRYESLDDPLFKEAWALSNLQPLWKSENLRKGAKYQN